MVRQLILIFVLLIGVGKSFSLARRQVKEVNVVIITEKEYSAVGESNIISLQKEISVNGVANAAEIETSVGTRGRKMVMDIRKKTRKYKKVSMTSSAAVENYVGKRKADHHTGQEEGNWKDDFMAFSADYRAAKSHPPKNN